MPFKTPENYDPVLTPQEEAPKRFRMLTEEEKQALGLKKEPIEDKSKETIASPTITTKWINPETQTEQEIQIDLQHILREQKAFYKEKLNIEISEAEIEAIWNKNYPEIKKEIETYGYDTILIIPYNLPNEETLNENLIETMDEGGIKGKVAQTFQSDNFKNGGSFTEIKNSQKPSYRIILTKGDQNIKETTDPYLKATLGKNIPDLTGLTEHEISERIQKGEELPINFKIQINRKEQTVKAEGLSLQEYMVFQRMYFEKNKKHLDEKGWTWLTKSYSGSRVVDAYWIPGDRQLGVFAADSSISDSILGLRLSRSFS